MHFPVFPWPFQFVLRPVARWSWEDLSGSDQSSTPNSTQSTLPLSPQLLLLWSHSGRLPQELPYCPSDTPGMFLSRDACCPCYFLRMIFPQLRYHVLSQVLNRIWWGHPWPSYFKSQAPSPVPIWNSLFPVPVLLFSIACITLCLPRYISVLFFHVLFFPTGSWTPRRQDMLCILFIAVSLPLGRMPWIN